MLTEKGKLTMPDMEKVIKGLHDIAGFIAGRIGIEQARNFLRTIDDAIALLKEQEAVEPKKIDGKRNHFIKCENCNYDLVTGFQFCPHCGRAVKLDG